MGSALVIIILGAFIVGAVGSVVLGIMEMF
jgi:hypothetical protein